MRRGSRMVVTRWLISHSIVYWCVCLYNSYQLPAIYLVNMQQPYCDWSCSIYAKKTVFSWFTSGDDEAEMLPIDATQSQDELCVLGTQKKKHIRCIQQYLISIVLKWMKWFKLCAGKCVMAIWIQKMAMDWCNIIVCCNVFVKGCRSLSRKRKMFAKLLPIGVPIWQSTLVWSDDHWDWRSKRLSMDQFDWWASLLTAHGVCQFQIEGRGSPTGRRGLKQQCQSK